MPYDKHFEDRDFSEQRPFVDEVDDCRFDGCNFTDSDLGEVTFIDCTFDGCDLSMANLGGAGLQEVDFVDCKLVGVDFEACSDFAFAVDFEECKMDFVSFRGLDMPETTFSGCSLREAVFADADLTEAVFEDCDLSKAVFNRTVLESADLRSARHFSIDPERNRVRHAKFARDSLEGLLDRYELDIE